MVREGIRKEQTGSRKRIRTMLVTLLKNEILRRGCLPYYGTAVSHIASQKAALGSGALPAWAELAASRTENR